MNITQSPIADVKPYGKNAKKHPDKQVLKIAASIREFGFNQPIVVDKDGVIIVGHGRYLAAQHLGLTDIPVLEVDITPEKAKAYRLADNKLNESEWDMQLVIAELKELSIPMLDLTGFSRDLVLENDEKDDYVPAVPKLPKSRVGDLYILGAHRLLCGDSTKQSDLAVLMDGKKADMIFTDPPYNVDYEGSTGLKIENDKKGDGEFFQFLLDVFRNAGEVTKLGGAIYVCHADLEGLNFRRAFKEAGFSLKSTIIWNKNALVMGRADYQWKHEPILYGWRDGATHSWYGDRKQTTVWDMAKPMKNDVHPTMKPVELVQKAVVNSSKQDDIVLDLFAGGGSTIIASQKSCRSCFAMELDPKYVDVIVERYCEFVGSREITKNGEKIVW